MMRRISVGFVCAIALLSYGTPLVAQSSEESEPPADEAAAEAPTSEKPVSYSHEGRKILVERDGETIRTLEGPCRPRALGKHEGRLYLACGAQGLFIYDITTPEEPIEVGFEEMAGHVIDLFELRGKVWAELIRREARPVDGTTIAEARSMTKPKRRPVPEREEESSTGTEPTPETEPDEEDQPAESVDPPPEEEAQAETEAREEEVRGKVVKVQPGMAIIDFGKAQGIKVGDRVEIYAKRSVDLGGGESSTREVTQAIGDVVTVGENRSQVNLGVNEQVEVAQLARTTDVSLTSDPMVPPRASGITSFSASFRPFLGLETDVASGGTVSAFSLTHAFEGPVLFELRMDPLGLGLSGAGNIAAIAGEASLSYDTNIFRLGLGAGATALEWNDFGEEGQGPKAGFQLIQTARLGARDGLNLQMHNSFALDDGTFVFAGFDGGLQVPLNSVLDGTWLIFRGGAHIAGRAFGEMGLRVLTKGNGGGRSLFVTPTIGGGSLWGLNGAHYAGPMLGIDLEWRFPKSSASADAGSTEGE
jgi:hypothetical protein